MNGARHRAAHQNAALWKPATDAWIWETWGLRLYQTVDHYYNVQVMNWTMPQQAICEHTKHRWLDCLRKPWEASSFIFIRKDIKNSMQESFSWFCRPSVFSHTSVDLKVCRSCAPWARITVLNICESFSRQNTDHFGWLFVFLNPHLGHRMLKCTVFEIGLKKHHVFFQVCSISPRGRIKTLCVSKLYRKGDI